MSQLIASYKERLNFLNSNDVFTVFGAGSGGQKVIDYLLRHNKTVRIIFDNDQSKHGTTLKGIPVSLPLDCIVNDYPVVIASTWHFDIVRQLDKLNCTNFCDFSLIGIAKEKMSQDVVGDLEWFEHRLCDENSKAILDDIANYVDNKSNVMTNSNYEQYHHAKIQLKPADIVIDGGAFDAESTISLANYFDNNLQIHAFEPEDENIIKCKKTINEFRGNSTITLIPKGLWSSQTTLYFNSSNVIHGASCAVDSEGDIQVPVIDIDGYCKGNKLDDVSYIKMDIEGAEYEALQGARDTIAKSTPKLAICLYHDFDDLWRLPRLIERINPNYDFYLGHHSTCWFETVLYCIPKL